MALSYRDDMACVLRGAQPARLSQPASKCITVKTVSAMQTGTLGSPPAVRLLAPGNTFATSYCHAHAERENCVYGILQVQATVDHSSPQLQVHQVAQHKLCASFWGRGPKGAGTGMAVRACKASFLAQRILRPRDALPVRGGAFNPIALGKPVNEPVRTRAPSSVPHSATSRAADRRCAGRRAAARAGRAAVGRRHRQPRVLPGPVPARQQGHPLAAPRPALPASMHRSF